MKKIITFLILALITFPILTSDSIDYCGIEVTPHITRREVYAGQTNVIGSFIVRNTMDHEQEIKINPLIEQIEEKYRLPNPRMIFTDESHFWLKGGEEKEITVLIGFPREEKYEFKHYKTGLEVTAEYKNRAVSIIVAVEIDLLENKYTIEDYELMEKRVEKYKEENEMINKILYDTETTLMNYKYSFWIALGVICILVGYIVVFTYKYRKVFKEEVI